MKQRSAEEWKELLRKLRVRPSKAMGQNFLLDTDVVEEITRRSGIEADDRVLEIGPGLGILSRAVLNVGAVLTAVELDRDLAHFLRGDLGDETRFRLIEQDARYLNPRDIMGDRPYQVVANLPYSVATPILRNLMESDHPPTQMTVMVQREVAERMAAEAGHMSLLGLATQLYTDPEIVMIVPPDVFNPPPKVDSAVIILRSRPELPGTDVQRNRMFELATMAFQRKRKTLANGLAMGLGQPKSVVEQALERVDIDTMARPQNLTVKQWLAVAEVLP